MVKCIPTLVIPHIPFMELGMNKILVAFLLIAMIGFPHYHCAPTFREDPSFFDLPLRPYQDTRPDSVDVHSRQPRQVMYYDEPLYDDIVVDVYHHPPPPVVIVDPYLY